MNAGLVIGALFVGGFFLIGSCFKGNEPPESKRLRKLRSLKIKNQKQREYYVKELAKEVERVKDITKPLHSSKEETP